MFDIYLLEPAFSGIKSSSCNLDAQISMIKCTLYVITEAASSLLFFFFMIRVIVEYIQYHLSPLKVLSSLYMSFFSLIVVWFLLHYYMEIFNFLDGIVHAIMKKIQLEDALANAKEVQEALDNATLETAEDKDLMDMFFSSIKDLLYSLLHGTIKVIASVLGFTMDILRTQLILFTLQIGPLAIVTSILPGDFSKVASYWFKTLLSFLLWGITMDIIDFCIISTGGEGLSGLVASISAVILYTMVGPLTSIFIGHTMSNGFFSFVLVGSNQMLSPAKSAGSAALGYLNPFKKKKESTEKKESSSSSSDESNSK